MQAGDLYSLGVLLWELLTGELVWLSDTPAVVKERVVEYEERPIFPDYTPYAYEVNSQQAAEAFFIKCVIITMGLHPLPPYGNSVWYKS